MLRELVDSFTGRWNQATRAPVEMRMYYSMFTDRYTLEMSSGYKTETYNNLSEAEALQKWVSNKRWWS